MSNTIKKKKRYQAAVRAQVVKGFINDAGGGWISANSGLAMHRDMVYGYKLGGGTKKKKVKASAEIE